ncbi:LPS export ABC transporter periplasmic protein LptC [Mucilaginibacter sp. PPCGB 2223]|uniref:LPS export ABC transporter periplasmic protein LptC n=1 Tax=Mucilaginibacter sp. PPCGB 2223 TaxID=1886027 RepID=UPI0008253CA4|nr:LPS export ABC transporter periplasmic protein LptC [Mucilaginibacter sp. PPCGB 2223]OCX50305.1 LPS export ABC transporter periplasmic protein LptC [Mucilaginibacter sp. PPCGB 2223]
MGQATKWLTGSLIPAVLMAVLLSACENDLKNVRAISAKQFTNPVDSSLAVEVTYSDSAHVKAVLKTPLLLDYKNAKKPYKEMPRGIRVTFYDKNLNVLSTVVSDYAVTSQEDKIITFKRNVVVTNAEGDTFKSSELTWDSIQKQIYSNQPVELNKIDGTHLNFSNFKSNENGTDYSGDNGYGPIVTKGNITQ